MRRLIFQPISDRISKNFDAQVERVVFLQQQQLHKLLAVTYNTAFGKAHGFENVRSYADYCKATPLISYEQLRPWIDRIAGGEPDVLWPGKPKYFALSSGTSSGVKYIPVTPQSLKGTLHGKLLYTSNFTSRMGMGVVHSGSFILFADSHHFIKHGEIPAAAISAILSVSKPWYIRNFDYPTRATQEINSYDEKVSAMIRETMGKRITGIVAMPPWLMLFLQRLPEITGKTFAEVYPDFKLLCTSGMNYEPYRQLTEKLIGKPFEQVQAYPSSEGFFGFQYNLGSPDLVLLPQNGIFFEFIPEEELSAAEPKRFRLGEVETGVRYALAITTNAGLCAYMPGDIIEFTSLRPHLIRIAGRIGSILNVFGEHLTIAECEEGIAAIAREKNCPVIDFALHAVQGKEHEKPYHEWFVAFEEETAPAELFAAALDAWLVQKSLCYRDLIKGNAMLPLRITMLQPDAFEKVMRRQGKTGTQVKPLRFLSEELARLLAEFKK